MNADPEQDVASSAAAQTALLASTSKTDAVSVLLIEDDENYREVLAEDLSDRGFSVRSFADGASFLQSLDAAVDADVILLDWRLPQTSGIDLLPQIRRHGIRLPVVFLTGRSSAEYESLAFERGASDFIDKARGVDVLAKRLRHTVETAAGPIAASPAEKSMVLGKLVLEPNVSRAYWNRADVGLTVGEYKIVDLLASNPGRYVTYRAIYDRMHYAGFVAGNGDHGYRANVRSAIKRIRLKFHQFDPDFDAIQNYTSFGYCWKKPA
jgi:two-component system, OmpR family, response regulator ChvI